MTRRHPSSPTKVRARQLRKAKTKSEGLLWSVLRASQLCGLKFRREHPIGPYFADFACISERVVIEIDGGYHDTTGEADLQREAYLKHHGWRVLRFTAREVEKDAEAVARGIAHQLGRPYEFTRRRCSGSGIMNTKLPKKKSPDPPRP